MKKLLLLAITFMVFSTGCATMARWKAADNETTNFSPTNAKDVLVYSTDEIDRPYLIIGPVVAAADAGEDAEIVVNMLKDEAAKLGADAIVKLELNPTMGYWQSAIQAKGIAVKFEEGNKR